MSDKAIQQMQAAACDLVMPQVMMILDDHQFWGDACECGEPLDNTTTDPEEGEVVSLGWVSWVSHIEKVTLALNAGAK